MTLNLTKFKDVDMIRYEIFSSIVVTCNVYYTRPSFYLHWRCFDVQITDVLVVIQYCKRPLICLQLRCSDDQIANIFVYYIGRNI